MPYRSANRFVRPVARILVQLCRIDLPARLDGALPAWLTQLGVATFMVGVAVALRLTLNAVAPGVVPFALLFPAILAATLVAGSGAGFMALGIGGGMSWYFVLEPVQSFDLRTPTQAVSLILFFVAAFLVLGLADIYRRSARMLDELQSARIDEGQLRLRELDHRVRNGFQLVSSVIQLQRRRAQDDRERAALDSALARLESISSAYALLAASNADGEAICMGEYLRGLSKSLADALLSGSNVELETRIEDLTLDREQAIAIGMVVTELLTNAMKYAFPDGRAGVIRVEFGPSSADEFLLLVADNGVGLPADPSKPSGLGLSIVRAFASRSGGRISTREGGGACFELRAPARRALPGAGVPAGSPI